MNTTETLLLWLVWLPLLVPFAVIFAMSVVVMSPVWLVHWAWKRWWA